MGLTTTHFGFNTPIKGSLTGTWDEALNSNWDNIDALLYTIQGLASDNLKLAGGTMTGALVLYGAPTQNLHASTKKYVDDAVSAINASSTSAATASTIVKRDASANFSANIITASFVGNLTGNISGNASTATLAVTATTAITANNATAHINSTTGTEHGATASNIANTIMKRDENGFVAGHIVGNLRTFAKGTAPPVGGSDGDLYFQYIA